MNTNKLRQASGDINVRDIGPADNVSIAKIVRAVLTEFGANRPGFAWQDPELDYMSEAYSRAGRLYCVLEQNGCLLGGGGIAEFVCEQRAVCELQKMYLLPEGRGHGYGRALLEFLLRKARMLGYAHCYLETLSSMTEARKLYERVGFRALNSPMGSSGHNACDQWYLYNLSSIKEAG